MRIIHRWPLAIGGLFIALLLAVNSNQVLADSLTLSGTVQTPTGGVYTEGGGVTLYNNSGFWKNSGIDSSGNFSISGIPAGTYTFDVGPNQSSSYAKPAQQQMTITSDVTGFTIKVATPVLTGTVTTPDGTATSGCFNVHDSTWTVNRGDCTNSDGRFKIGALSAGSYTLEVSPNGNSSYVASSRTITVTDPATTVDLGLVRLDAPSIFGTVALPDGTLVPWNDDWNQRLHLSVDMWNSDWTINKHSDFDSSSKFKFGPVPAGTYTIHVNIWDTELYTGSVNTTITVPASGVLDLTATPIRLSTPQLSGVVYRPDGVTPIYNAYVSLRNDDGSQNQGSNTDQNGKYRIGGLPAGTYTLDVGLPSDVTDLVRPDPVAVTITTSLTTRNITLSEAKKIVSGRVIRKSGTGVSCAQINANRRGGSGWANARTKSDGTFTLVLAPGSWNIRTEPDRSFDCPTSDWVYLDPEAVVEFSTDNSSQTESVTFTVTPATAIITGTVKKKDGSPVTNGNVNANSQTRDGRNRWSNAQIQADGSFKLYLVGGTYDLNVWTQDNRLFTRNQKVTVADNATTKVAFIVSEKLAHIKGRVTTKAGTGLPNIQLNGNLDCGPEGCSAWSNTRTDANGYYDMATTAGRWNINFDSGQGASYVYDGPPMDVFVETETTTVSDVNFSLVYADVTIKGKIIDDSGKPFSDFPGWVFVRPLTTTAERQGREFGGPVNQGTFNFRVPSSLYSLSELGVHTPPNSMYSPSANQQITLVADATIEKNITVQQNNAAIVGRAVDGSGLPFGKCNFRGEVFANSKDGQWHGTQINPDCTYEISLLAGTYQLGYHFDETSGILNRPPQNEQIIVGAGTRVEKNIKVLAGDAQVKVLVLNPDGTPARRVWIWADNHEEIDRQRQSGEEHRTDENFRGPGDTSSPKEMMNYCSKKEHEKECADFKLPGGAAGPGGCKDALACTKYCKKNPKECDEGSKPKAQSIKVTATMLTRQARVASLRPVRAAAEDEKSGDFFDDMIGSGTEAGDVGTGTLNLLSGHEYTINAGLPPDNPYMPPVMQRVSLKNSKSANLILQLRKSDGRMSGFVTWNGNAVSNGYVGCWSEDGNSNGSPIQNATYGLNYTFGSTYHCNANAFDGTTFLQSEEQIITIGREKTKKANFTLGTASFQIPPPVSESFDATSPHVITLGDGTTLNIPANTIASSGTVTVNANPTVSIQRQKTAQPLGYGYNFEAVDSDNKVVSKFNGNITASFKYSDEQLAAAGIDEESLVPSYWDAASGAWKKPSNITHNTTDNVITVTTDHFTSYAMVGTSGKGRGQNLVPIKTTTSRGITKITIGSGKTKKIVTPFPSYRGSVSVGTMSVRKTGQVVFAAQAGTSGEATKIKVYSLKGKLTRTITPWGSGYRQGATLTTDDLTADSYDDVIAASTANGQVRVYDLTKKREYGVAAGSGRVVVATLDLNRTGSHQLVTKTGRTIRTWKFNNGFKTFSFDQRKLSVSGDSVERVVLQPGISRVTPTSVKAGKGTATITIIGSNFGAGTRVLVNGSTTAKKVLASGDTKLTVTISTTSLKKNKSFSLTVINADGGQTEYNRLKTSK